MSYCLHYPATSTHIECIASCRSVMWPRRARHRPRQCLAMDFRCGAVRSRSGRRRDEMLVRNAQADWRAAGVLSRDTSPPLQGYPWCSPLHRRANPAPLRRHRMTQKVGINAAGSTQREAFLRDRRAQARPATLDISRACQRHQRTTMAAEHHHRHPCAQA